jgi:hypothetical protein
LAALHAFTGILMLPVLAVAFVGRTVWTAVLAFVAGMGMSSACNAENTKPYAGSGDPEPVVECYKQVAVSPTIMQDPRWAHSDLIADWAMAERAVLACATAGDVRYDDLQQKIVTAREATTNAKPIVVAGLLSQPAYDMALRVLDEWHADTAMSYSGVKCYKRMAPPPAVADTSSRLDLLSRLQARGQLSDEAVDQARESMKSYLTASLSAKQSAELADFLLDLLGFTQ